MVDLHHEICHTHQLDFTWAHAGSERKDGDPAVWQRFEIRAEAGGTRAVKINVFVTDDVAAGILHPEDHQHYPLTGERLLIWKLWTAVFDDAEQQITKAPDDREGYWHYTEHLFTFDGLVQLLDRYRQLARVDYEAGIPVRARYIHTFGHRLANTGTPRKRPGWGMSYLFRCVDCKRVAHLYQFRNHECWIPVLLDCEFRDGFRELGFRFAGPGHANKYGTRDFAVWHKGATTVTLYTANGCELGTLDVPADVEFEDLLAVVIDKWGPLASVQFSMSQYPAKERA
ncbi:hypothetical protein AOB60_00140 [Streptomyces noursei]|uniref:Uncharacterized protein n=1 Tax=Streptomyces noursei TaxID=1971 RepID=A0A2N8PQT5_STRNR|nr:hypothetical protein AOB60_00140 [Streptomyces noursei]